MRTTLDVDNDVLQAVKDIAAARKQTAGKVLSDLAREALTRPAVKREIVVENGFPLLKRSGGTVTPGMVERLIEEADLADAGVSIDR